MSAKQPKAAWRGRSLQRKGTVHGRLKKRAGYLARDAIEVTVGLLYFGHRIPLDPNLTVIIGDVAGC
jgi:hypothetical protein